MAHVTAEFPLSFQTARRSGAVASLVAFGTAIAHRYRQGRTYRRTLHKLQGYTERNLLDLGATQGVNEFARRAAGL